MSLLITVLVTFFAGMGAGLVPDLLVSAAAVISPMLINTFLDMIPIWLWVLHFLFRCSCQRHFRLYIWKKYNLDIKNGIIMMISVLAFTVVEVMFQSCTFNYNGDFQFL